MKGKKFAALPVAFAMALALGIGSMGTMVTGLDLPVADMAPLYIAFAITALAGCGIFLFEKGWIAAVVLACGGFAYLWRVHYLSEPIRALITRLSWIYDSAYGWGMLEFAGVNWHTVSLELPLAFWGCLTVLSAARAMMQGRWLGLTLLLALLPLCTTVVVTNTVPDPIYLYILILAVVLLLLSATVRQQDPGQGAALTALTVLPVALLLGLLFHFCPKDGYVNHSEEYLDRVVSWWQNTVSFSIDNTGLVDQTPATPNASATANLSRVGPRNNWGYTVMEAEADWSGTVYLRGQDFDAYDGVSWAAMEDRSETFGGLPSYGTWVYDGNLTIFTATPANVLYLPYYPTAEQPLEGGRMENTENLRAYSVGVRHPQELNMFRFDAASTGSPDIRYTSLPSDTRRWAVQYLQAHFTSDVLNTSRNHLVAEAIADHVRGLVPYDTNTPRMSGEYDDFVRWFLEEADTGYCVHFASAATVLLRAAGVPARYVTGYMFTAEAGETVEVTADQAHAWAEYYHEGLNAWVVLEATPADLRQEEETDPPATEPEETEPPTEVPSEEEQETRPDGEQPGGDDRKADLSWLWTALLWLLLPAGIWLAVLTQYRIRRKLRRPGKHPNARVLAYWADVEILCRVTKQDPPEALEFLAQKAKFSQHTLTPDELAVFHTWLAEQRQKLQKTPWYRRFVYKYMLALW